MRLPLALLAFLILTPLLGGLVVLAALLRLPDRPGSIYDWAPRLWATMLVRAAGVRIELHGAEHMVDDAPRIYAANHVSWFDVFVLASVLPRYKFVAKAELFRIPIFGPGARAVGTIPIHRENRKAAFGAYDEAAERIRGGSSVVVYPEGTRGRDYPLRPFKKGPFVLATAAQVPVVPTLLHGTIAVQARDSWRINAGLVHVHFLEPVPTTGLTYADRDRLSDVVWQRLSDAQHRLYGVVSVPAPARATPRPSPTTSPT